jgi:hypothetical protein
VHDKKALKGRALKSVYAACIYCAAKREKTPRTFKEICAVMPDVNKVDIGRCFTSIDRCALGCSHVETNTRSVGTCRVFRSWCMFMMLVRDAGREQGGHWALLHIHRQVRAGLQLCTKCGRMSCM